MRMFEKNKLNRDVLLMVVVAFSSMVCVEKRALGIVISYA